MSLQFYNLGRIARASLSHGRLINPSLYGSLLTKKPGFLATTQIVCISTSKKNGDTITSDITTSTKPQTPAPIFDNTRSAPRKKKYYQSYGFSYTSEERDHRAKNLAMFWLTTIALVGISFTFLYFPDAGYRDWSQREAYIELARREALGLPLIDPDLIPVEDIHLPTEEELGQFEIII